MSFYRQFRLRTVPILIAILLAVAIVVISMMITYPSDTAYDWGPGNSAYEWPPDPKKH